MISGYPLIVLKSNNELGKKFPVLWKVKPHTSKLYVQGKPSALELLHLLPEKGFAIVGARDPQNRSLHLLRSWIFKLKGAPLIILSGFAKGIDAMAHTAALDVQLPTIAILGAGLNFNYPKPHYHLRKRILESGGLLISEYEPNTEPFGGNFIKRNRFIAGLSRAVLVVEASARSGALSTANWAKNQEQECTCYAVPCFPDDPAFAGNQILIDQYNATPFWGPQNLGSTWINMNSFKTRQLNFLDKLENKNISEDVAVLVQKVAELTHLTGGAQVTELLDWAIQKNWTPQAFYNALRYALESQVLLDENGLLLKSF